MANPQFVTDAYRVAAAMLDGVPRPVITPEPYRREVFAFADRIVEAALRRGARRG